MVDPITPMTEITPEHTSRAEDVAVGFDLPSRKNSTEAFEGFKLEEIDASDHVRASHEIVRDRKTGKHYKKVPAWSLAHAKAQQNVGKPKEGPKFSLAHSFGDKGRDPGSVGSGVKIGGSKTPPTGGQISALDLQALVTQLRSVSE